MSRHRLVATAIQWPTFKHGVETWVLWHCACGCGKGRVEKIDGKWQANELGYLVQPVLPASRARIALPEEAK